MTARAETIYDRLLSWRAGETPGPWQISLYPTYRCNIECKICWKRAFPEPLKANEELPDARILEIVDEAAAMNVRQWVIGGGGELMLRRKMVMEMCERIRRHGMNGLIQTNGTIFSDDHIDRLIDMEWRELMVSLDGPTRELNNAIRVENNWDMTYDFLQRIQRRKKERGALNPVVNLVSVITNLNYDKMNLFVDLAESLELDPGFLTCVDLIVYGENDKKFELSPAQRAEMPARLRETVEYARTKGVTTWYETFLSACRPDGSPMQAMDLFSEPCDRVSSKTMCYEPFTHMVIVPEGNAGPCCTWHDLTSDSVRNQPLREVWTGPYMSRVREQLMKGKAPSYCSECMPTRVAANQTHQTRMAHLELAQAVDATSWPQFVGKAVRSLRSNGVSGSITRGKEWLQLRRDAKRLLR